MDFRHILIAGYAIPTILHIVGVVLLYKAKRQLPNQRILTMALAIAEMLFCLRAIIHNTMWLVGLTSTWGYNLSYVFLKTLLMNATRFTMLHIIVDRFLDIWLNLKYPLYINQYKLKIIVICQWIFGLLLAILSLLLVLFKIISIQSFLRLAIVAKSCLDVVIIIVALVTFIYLFMKVKSVIHRTNSQQRRQRKQSGPTTTAWYKVRVPFLMVATFIVFNAGGFILFIINHKLHNDNRTTALYCSFAILDICGWTSDALIYIFCRKRVRRLLVNRWSGLARNKVRLSRWSRMARNQVGALKMEHIS